jgi:hypothetical protein
LETNVLPIKLFPYTIIAYFSTYNNNVIIKYTNFDLTKLININAS